jgi:hypothetical protein
MGRMLNPSVLPSSLYRPLFWRKLDQTVIRTPTSIFYQHKLWTYQSIHAYVLVLVSTMLWCSSSWAVPGGTFYQYGVVWGFRGPTAGPERCAPFQQLLWANAVGEARS